MTGAFLALPAHQRRRLARALESGTLGLHCSPASLRAAVGLEQGGEALAAALARHFRALIDRRLLSPLPPA